MSLNNDQGVTRLQYLHNALNVLAGAEQDTALRQAMLTGSEAARKAIFLWPGRISVKWVKEKIAAFNAHLAARLEGMDEVPTSLIITFLEKIVVDLHETKKKRRFITPVLESVQALRKKYDQEGIDFAAMGFAGKLAGELYEVLGLDEEGRTKRKERA